MAVQAGEGTTDIIYGGTSVPAGPRTFGGYLARPDGAGEWPTVIVYGPTTVPSSSIKHLCRMIGRHGVAALAPEMAADRRGNLRASRAVADFIGNPTGDWSNAEYGYGVLAFEAGLADAAALAAVDGRCVALACVGGSIDDPIAADLVAAEVPVLFIASRGDDAVDLDASLAVRDRLTDATFVVYPDGDTGFWNDDAAGFREDRYRDTLDRVVAFFADQLPPRV